MSANNGGAGTSRSRPFSVAQRREIMALVPSKQSGVIITLGSFTINIVTLAAGELIDLLYLQEQQKGGRLSERDVPRLYNAIRSVLLRSLVKSDTLNESEPEEMAVFDEWVAAWDLTELSAIVVPAIARANGVNVETGRPQAAAGESSTSTPSTPPDSSQHTTTTEHATS